MHIILRCNPCSKYMFLCCLVSSLSPIVFYQVYFQCFPLAGLRLRFLLICVPPRPKTAWLVLRSVVPYRSLFFLPPLCASTLNWPLGPATLSLYRFAHFWLTFSRSAKSFPDRLFYRPGILFPAACFLRPDLITALCFWLRFLDRLFRRPLFPAQLCPTGYFGGRIAFFCRSAIHLCFYRSALGPAFWGLCYSAALLLVAPQPSPASWRSQWCLLVSGVSRGPPSWPFFVPPFWSLSGSWTLLDRSSRRLPFRGFPTY